MGSNDADWLLAGSNVDGQDNASVREQQMHFGTEATTGTVSRKDHLSGAGVGGYNREVNRSPWFFQKGANWYRPGKMTRWWRVVVNRKAT